MGHVNKKQIDWKRIKKLLNVIFVYQKKKKQNLLNEHFSNFKKVKVFFHISILLKKKKSLVMLQELVPRPLLFSSERQ